MFACRLLIGFALAASASGYFRAAEPVPASEPKPAPVGEPVVTPKPPAANPADAATSRGVRDPVWAAPPLEPVARAHFEKGQYKEALDAYTRSEPQSFCYNCAMSMRDNRYRRIALCHAHLGDHAAAARVCLEAAGAPTWGDTGVAEFAVQLYRAAEQLEDLTALLDVIEKGIIDKQHPKAWLLTPDEWLKLLGLRGTLVVRSRLKASKLDELKPWPDGVPKPKPGSLPKTLPK